LELATFSPWQHLLTSNGNWLYGGTRRQIFENGIIFGAAMAEKKLENDEVRYSVAYPTGAERCRESCQNRSDLF